MQVILHFVTKIIVIIYKLRLNVSCFTSLKWNENEKKNINVIIVLLKPKLEREIEISTEKTKSSNWRNYLFFLIFRSLRLFVFFISPTFFFTFEQFNSLELLLRFHYQSPSTEENKTQCETTETMSRHKKWLRVCMCINMQSWLLNTWTILLPDNQNRLAFFIVAAKKRDKK